MRKEFENNKKNVLGNNPDLRDDIDDEIFRKMLREEFIEREKQIEEALFADKDVEDLVFTDEEVKDSYQELLRRFEREKRENAEHEASDSKIIEIKSRKTGVRWHQLGKVVGMAAVALACIFAASMTSEANRKYLMNSMRIWSGDDTKTVNYNDDSNENANLDEDKAIVDIEEKLGIEMPRFYYRPQGMQFENYEVEELLEVARIEYKYNDSVIILYIDKQNESSESKMNSRHGDESGTVVVNEEGTQVSISEIEDIDEKACYSAEWTKDSVMYCLSGRMDIKDLKKIIKEMKF